MSIIRENVECFDRKKFNVEVFDSADEMVKVSAKRDITDSRFDNEYTRTYSDSFQGCKDMKEALEFLKTGYKPVVEKLKATAKTNGGYCDKPMFKPCVEGFMPIVPLALKNVPEAMLNIKPVKMKNRVLNIYFDMTCNCDVTSTQLSNSTCECLAAIMDIERQGYRCNIYTTINFYKNCYGNHDGDMVMIKIKNSNTPLNLQRMSFTLTHPAFFRAIGFDWYSRFPKGDYKCGYGRSIAYTYSGEAYNKGMRELTGDKNGIFFSCAHNLHTTKNQYLEVLKNAGKNISR